MKKIFTLSLLLLSLNIVIAEEIKNKEIVENTKKENGEIKKFTSLKEAGDDYAKVMQEISNYSSRDMLKNVNLEVDNYVNNKNDLSLKEKWENINNMLLEQYEVSVHKVNEYGNLGDVILLIKGYDEEALEKYLSDNVSEYATLLIEKNNEVNIDIEKYIELQYNYLKDAKKVNIATSKVNFVKVNNEWKVIE